MRNKIYHKGNSGPLRFSAFVQAPSVNHYFSSEDGLNEAIKLFEANNISKVYLDCLRGGHFPGKDILIKARDFFENNGIKTAAGLTPTQGTGKGSTHGRWWLCYTNKETQEGIKEVVRETAEIFDEIIVDDFLCTHCQCAECQEARRNRTLEEYYRELLVQVARDCIINPARDETPGIRMIIKYPQWYDRFHKFGYDVTRHPQQFDEVWVGTEIRDPLVEYVHQYQAFANYRWLASLSGEKIGGAWFDFINCYPEIYVEQAVQSILAGARELIRFHYDPELYSPENPNTKALIRIMPELKRLAEFLGNSQFQGIHFYKPPDIDGEDEAFLLDYLGMLGLPMIPCSEFPSDARSICLPIQAASIDGIMDHVIKSLESGATIMLTPGFLQKLQHDERLLRIAGYSSPAVTKNDIWTFRFSVDQTPGMAESHIRFGANLHPVSAEVVVWGIHQEGNFPVITCKRHDRGKVIVFNAKTFCYPRGSSRVTTGEPVSLPHLPQNIVDKLRREMLSDFPLDINVRSRVGVYYYSGKLVLTNFNDQSVKVIFNLNKGKEKTEVFIPPRVFVTLKLE
ncbi:hypothetical protein GF312_19385 [Candidatus Poribacteria bacterium]|nr:hypothetical protein [Candidatus Poribacteria bacterium]